MTSSSKLSFVHAFLALSSAGAALAAAPDEHEARIRAFMDQHGVAPIEFKPGARLQSDVDEQWLKWAERTIVTPVAAHLARWPKHEKEAVEFVRHALRFRKTGRQFDPAITPASLLKRGEALLRAKVDDPMVLMLTGWAELKTTQRTNIPDSRLKKAATHASLKDLPASIRMQVFEQLHEVQLENRDGYEFVAERIEAARLAVEDPNTFGPDDDEILVNQLSFLFNSTFFRENEEKILTICELPHYSEWTYNTLRGHWENSKAWKFRGTGYANNVSNDGWLGFQAHLPKAREFLTKAWELHPERPDPAVTLLNIANSGGEQKGESARLWFDRATAAQFDLIWAYRSYLTASLPRWGGSVEHMKAFGLACALTRRYDTWTAGFVLDVARRLRDEHDDWQPVYRDELLGPELLRAAEYQITDPARAWDKPRIITDQALRSYACGDLKRASELIKLAPSPFPAHSRRYAGVFNTNESEMRGRCAIFDTGKYETWQQMETAYAEKDLEKAGAGYAGIATSFGDDVPHLLAGRIAAVKAEKLLDTGAWVPMNVTPKLENWTIQKGRWEGTSDGVLQHHGESESGFILYNARIGPNFEIRGEYEVTSPTNRAQGLGVVVGHSRYGTTEEWLTCQQFRVKDHCEATLLNRYTKSSAPYVSIGKPTPKFTFLIRSQDDLITYIVNDKEILKDHAPRSSEKSNYIIELKPDCRVGFAHYDFYSRNITRILKSEVRRLK